MKLADAIEAELRSSPLFALSSGRKPGTLLITIPANVWWKKIGDRTQVRYTATFMLLPVQDLGTNIGVCWDNALKDCADQIVKDAQIKLSNERRTGSSAKEGTCIFLSLFFGGRGSAPLARVVREDDKLGPMSEEALLPHGAHFVRCLSLEREGEEKSRVESYAFCSI